MYMLYVYTEEIHIYIYICMWGGRCTEEFEFSIPSKERSQTTSVNKMFAKHYLFRLFSF